MVFNIVLVGAGALGSRHLQAMKNTNHECFFWVVDSSTESLDRCRKIYEDSPANKKVQGIEYIQNIDDLPKHIDFLLIATGSGPRFAIFKSITDRCKVKNVVFEKILFQKLDYYEEAALILEKKHINAWVNTPRRMWDFYEEIKPYFVGTPAHMFMIGGNWGLGCNSIHFIDLYAYLTGCTTYKIDTNGLDRVLYDSKRTGYKEINGLLHCTFSNGGSLMLDSSIVNLRAILTISNENITFSIDEGCKVCWINDANGNRVKTIKVPYQSQLTNLVLDNILDSGTCLLPIYKESDKLHRPFVKGVIDFINNELNGNIDKCPLT